MILKVASRNIWRSKKRSAILMAAISLGLWAGIFLMAFYNGLIEQRINTAISSELSHLQIHHPTFRKEFESIYFLSNGKELLKSVAQHKNTKAATGRILVKGMIASPAGSSGVSIVGVLPAEENKVTNLQRKIRKGTYFESRKKNEILISERLRKKLRLDLKKKTVLTFQDVDGNLASAAFRVVGMYKTGNTAYDDATIFVPISTIDSLSGIKNTFNEIAVLLNSNKNLEQTQKELQQQFPQTEVKNWMEISPEIGLVVSFGTQMVIVIMGIILLALLFGIVNTMMMSVLERTYEIGMLLALGMNKFKIFTMIVAETFLLILAGCPLGISLAFLTIAITDHYGIRFSELSDVYSSFGFDPVIYPKISVEQFGTIMLLVAITALVSSIFPARKAISLKPAESIKK